VTEDDHAKGIGALLGNLQILETMVRARIATLDPTRYKPWRWDDLVPGRELPEDAFTATDSLGPMIAVYNDLVDEKSRIDRDGLVALRDALAHGRVWTLDCRFPVKLVKFRKSRPGWVTVEWAEDMTVDWFKKQMRVVGAAVAAVQNS
jgi:hypothetical protein